MCCFYRGHTQVVIDPVWSICAFPITVYLFVFMIHGVINVLIIIIIIIIKRRCYVMLRYIGLVRRVWIARKSPGNQRRHMRHTSTTVEAVGALQSTCYQQKTVLFSFNDWNILPSNNLLIEKLSYCRPTTRRISRSLNYGTKRFDMLGMVSCCSSFVSKRCWTRPWNTDSESLTVIGQTDGHRTVCRG